MCEGVEHSWVLWPPVPPACPEPLLSRGRSGRLSLSLCPSAISWHKRERPEMIPRPQSQTFAWGLLKQGLCRRTRTTSTDIFYVRKSREILAVLVLPRTQKSFLYANLVKGESNISLSSTYLHSHRRRAGQEQILWLESRGPECSARGSSVAAPLHTQGCLSLGESTNTQGEPWNHTSWAQSMWGAQWSHTTVKLSAGPSEKG